MKKSHMNQFRIPAFCYYQLQGSLIAARVIQLLIMANIQRKVCRIEVDVPGKHGLMGKLNLLNIGKANKKAFKFLTAKPTPTNM